MSNRREKTRQFRKNVRLGRLIIYHVWAVQNYLRGPPAGDEEQLVHNVGSTGRKVLEAVLFEDEENSADAS